VAVPGARFEDPAIPAVLPLAFALDSDTVSDDPLGYVELWVSFASRVDPEAARFLRLGVGSLL